MYWYVWLIICAALIFAAVVTYFTALNKKRTHFTGTQLCTTVCVKNYDFNVTDELNWSGLLFKENILNRAANISG